MTFDRENKWLASSGMVDIYLHIDGRIRVIAPYRHEKNQGYEEWPRLREDGTIIWANPERIGVGVQRETLQAFEDVKNKTTRYDMVDFTNRDYTEWELGEI